MASEASWLAGDGGKVTLALAGSGSMWTGEFQVSVDSGGERLAGYTTTDYYPPDVKGFVEALDAILAYGSEGLPSLTGDAALDDCHGRASLRIALDKGRGHATGRVEAFGEAQGALEFRFPTDQTYVGSLYHQLSETIDELEPPAR